jgi:AraC-like DNA-binding protein
MSDISKFITAHREALKHTNNLLVNKTAHSHFYHVSTFKHEDGNGFSDVYDFGRVCISRGNFKLYKNKELQSKKSISLFGFTIYLQGIHQIKNDLTGDEITIRPPQMILRKGEIFPHTVKLFKHQQMSIISLDFDKAILDNFVICEDLCGFVDFFSEASSSCYKLCDIQDQRIIYQAEQLLRKPPVEIHNELDLLHLEGEALALLGLLLQGGGRSKTSIRPEILQAVAILEHEFDQKITIPQLSKRVGMNECDLKRKFKSYTHTTIADYLMQQRMSHAITLLAKGNHVQEVAYKVGYNSTQHFKQVFKKKFGYEAQDT